MNTKTVITSYDELVKIIDERIKAFVTGTQPMKSDLLQRIDVAKQIYAAKLAKQAKS